MPGAQEDLEGLGAGEQGGLLQTAVGSFVSLGGDGVRDMEPISFAGLLDSATITLRKSKLNDGFGIDDVAVGSSVAAIPLPPAVFALLAGVGALALAARRSRRPA